MVARIATLSLSGRPSVNPLYFVRRSGHIWLGTVDWTLAARNVMADPRVSVLFEVERNPRGPADRADQRARQRAGWNRGRSAPITCEWHGSTF